MTTQQILESNGTKTAKAKALYSLGFTRQQVANMLCNGNYGFAHNIWKKWNAEQTATTTVSASSFNFEFNRTFGIELEVYDLDVNRLISELTAFGISIVRESYNHDTRNYWKIITDSSIRGVNGYEIVSPVLKGAEGLEQVKKVCIALNRIGAKVNASCGFHAHFSVNDLSLNGFKNLVNSYMNTEKQVDDFMPKSRRRNNNHYCKSIIVSRSISKTQALVNNSESVQKIASDVFNGCRYFKLNVQSYLRYGTVEFRQHSGTIQYSKIKNWLLICARMVEYAKQVGVFNNLNDVLNESLQDYVSDRTVDLVA